MPANASVGLNTGSPRVRVRSLRIPGQAKRAMASPPMTSLSASAWRAAALAVLFALAGCTSLQPVAVDPEVLREGIRAGELVRAGDRIAVTTEDGTQYAFTVAHVDADALSGDGFRVPIDRIATLRTERIDIVRTAGATGGTVAAAYIAAAVAAFLSVLEALE